jgi:hypothetical protein
MLKEAMTQSMTFVRPRDQTRNIGQYVLPVFAADHPQLRGTGRKRIAGDLGAGGTHLTQKRGFSRVGESDETYICKEPKLEAKPTRLTRSAILRSARCLVGGGGEGRISSPTTATSGNEDFCPFFSKIAEQFLAVFVENQCSPGNRKL